MRFRAKIRWRWFLVAVASFLVAGLAAPFLSADRFGHRVRLALEASLHRQVKIGKVHFDLFRGPGFSIDDVEIAEDPAFGIEPFAWVESIEARPQLSSLWTHKLEFASLRLDVPIVNLVKTGGRWNFEPLLTPETIATLPKIQVRDGRIYFKFGDTKSVFYFTNTDFDLTAHPLHAGVTDWVLGFTGEPARTDRARFGLGRLNGRGHWQHGTPAQDTLNLDVELERSPLSEVSALLFGRDAGIHGIVSSRARLAGPASNIRINGRLQLEELHRWDQMPMKGDGWPLEFQGRLSLTAQQLEIESQSAAGGFLPIAVRFRVSDYLAQPRWGVSFNWNRFPAEPLLPLARHMGVPLPVDLKASGTLDGAVSWSGQDSLQGQLAFHEAAFLFPGSAPIHCDAAQILFDGDRVHLSPALVYTPPGGRRKTADDAAESAATLEADYRWSSQALDLNISSDFMSVSAIRSHAARLPAPFLEALSTGVWNGKLRYQRGPGIEEGWSGQVQLHRATIALPGVAEPLRLRSATARLEGSKLAVEKLQGRIGTIDLEGDYRQDANSPRAARFHLAAGRIDAAELERLLLPTLRRREGFIARTLGIGQVPLPDWLAGRHLDGTADIGSLTVAGVDFSDLHSRVRWNAASLRLTGMEAKLDDASARADLTVGLEGDAPAYRLQFQLDSLAWNDGAVNADGVLETSGIGDQLLANLRSEGSFAAGTLELAPLGEVTNAHGCYRFEWAARAPRIRFPDLEFAIGDETFIGRGATQDDGRLLLQLSSGSRQLRVTGNLAQLRAE